MDTPSLFLPVNPPGESADFPSHSDHGSDLGRLADLADFLLIARSGKTGEVTPRFVAFTGEHGDHLRSSDPRAEDNIADLITEKSMLSAFGVAHQRLIDVSLTTDIAGIDPQDRVRAGSGDVAVEDAMSSEELHAALALGARVADEEIDRGEEVLVPVQIGPGGALAATAVLGELSTTEPVALMGFVGGSHTRDADWSKKVALIRDVMFRIRGLRSSPLEVLRVGSAPEIAALASFIARAAARRTPVLLDGLIDAVAALIAQRLTPGTARWLIAGQLSPLPAHRIVLRELGVKPLIALNLSAAMGSGAATALPLVQAAARLPRPE